MQQEIETKLNNPPPSLLEKFDADHDGKLNDAEKATARAELTARAEQYLAEMKAGNVPGVGPGGVKSHAEMMAAYAAKLDNPTPEILQRFDTDHDGKLSPEEKATALKQIEEHMQKNAAMNAGGGGPGNGQASMTPEQQRAYIMARLDNPSPELLKRFDQDGDGKLSPEEKAAAVTQIMKQREKKADKAAPAGTAP